MVVSKKNNKKIIKLSGSYSGVKKFKKMKKFDIIKSEIIIKKKKNICQKNQIFLHFKNNKLYIYHSFNSIKNDYSGRWYNVDLIKTGKYKLDNKKFVFTHKYKDWEIFNKNTYKTTNAEIKIYFTENGWKKFKIMV